MPRSRPSIWQFCLILQTEEMGVFLQVMKSQAVGYQQPKVQGGKSEANAGMVTGEMIRISAELLRGIMTLKMALLQLSVLVGVYYGKYREVQLEKASDKKQQPQVKKRAKTVARS